MTQHVEIAVIGSGSLATEIMHALALESKNTLSVALLGRHARRLALLARSTTDLTKSFAGRLRVLTRVIDWSNDKQICRTLAALRPSILVHTASLQSPWTLNGSDRWSCLVKSAGFGLTLPLQTVLALKIGRAINSASPKTCLINACYPDAVNRVLCANGVRVTGGLGNVAILAHLLTSELGLKKDRRLRIIAHHAHLTAAIESHELKDAALKAWINEEPIHFRAANWLRNSHLPRNLNSIAGAAAVPMLLALMGRRFPWDGHCAGPLGLPGGYPVVVASNRVELDLPQDVSLAEGTALNMAAAISDGVVVNDNGEVMLSESSARVLKKVVGGNTDQLAAWHATEVRERAIELIALRESLSR